MSTHDTHFKNWSVSPRAFVPFGLACDVHILQPKAARRCRSPRRSSFKFERSRRKPVASAKSGGLRVFRSKNAAACCIIDEPITRVTSGANSLVNNTTTGGRAVRRESILAVCYFFFFFSDAVFR